MKKTLPILFTVILITLSSINNITAQEISLNNFSYQVAKVYPYIAISKKELAEAKILKDINKRYPDDWVREYKSVEIATVKNGKTIKAISPDDTLSKEQKSIILSADVDAEVVVTINYLPENNLKDNDLKEFDFSFWINPEKEANFKGGEEKLYTYLNQKVLNQISDSTYKDYAVSIINFTIDPAGNIIDPLIFQKSENDDIDALLLETICNMPKWSPAEYSNGLKVKQEMTFIVGNMENCILNTINFRPDRFLE